MSLRRALAASILAAFVAGPVAGATAGASTGGGPQEFVSRPEEDVLLLEARLGDLVLTDALPAFRLEGSFLLPLGELARLLSLAVEVDVARGTAEGFVLTEDRRFSLRAREAAVTISGVESRFDRTRVEVHEDDVYVDVALLSKWFPVDLLVDPYSARLTVRPREPLPVQLRAERERGAARLAAARRAPEGFPDAPNPYRLASVPSLDASLRVLVSPDDGGGQRVGFQHSALLTGDLLGAEASLFLNGNDGEAVSDAWGSLARRDPEGKLLGKLGLREAVLGEVASPGFELVSDAQTGPGFLFSSFPLQRPAEWGRTSLSGPLLPGWEVELYGNDSLLGYQASRADGLYEFADVPLLPGANELRLVFYGPQGQRQEEVRRINAAETFTPTGELRWRVVANDPRQVGRRGHLLAEYGLSKGLSVSGGVAGLRTERGRELGYGRLGAQLLRGIFLARVDGAVSGGSGTALRGELQARTAAFGFSAAYSVLDRFESEVFRPEFGTVSSRLELRFDVRPHLGAGIRLPISGQLRRDALEGGGDFVRATGQLSTNVSRLYVSSLWSWSRARRPGQSGEAIGFGTVLVSRLVRRTSLRGELQYDFDPDTTLRSAGLNGEFPIGPRLLGRGGLTWLRREGETLLIAGLSRRTGVFGVTFEATWGRSSRLNASLSVGIGLGRDPRSGRFHAQAPPFAAPGAPPARVLLDTNGDGVFNAGEPPVEGAGFFVNRGSVRTTTGPDGLALLPTLPTLARTEVSISTATLEDPLWVPKQRGWGFVPRPGVVTELDFPVTVTGEVTGTIRTRRGGQEREAPGIRLQLVSPSGEVAAETRSAYDGFYDLPRIPPGRYVLRVDPAQVARLGLGGEVEKAVEILPSGSILDGVDLLIEAGAPAPAAAPAEDPS
ncbi:MAG: hypothetical protein KBB14_18495 [Thermoanaerobaculia bacterium]|nr:hypothetical protein [Thermoanaerobaculia bacterium]